MLENARAWRIFSKDYSQAFYNINYFITMNVNALYFLLGLRSTINKHILFIRTCTLGSKFLNNYGKKHNKCRWNDIFTTHYSLFVILNKNLCLNPYMVWKFQNLYNNFYILNRGKYLDIYCSYYLMFNEYLVGFTQNNCFKYLCDNIGLKSLCNIFYTYGGKRNFLNKYINKKKTLF